MSRKNAWGTGSASSALASSAAADSGDNDNNDNNAVASTPVSRPRARSPAVMPDESDSSRVMKVNQSGTGKVKTVLSGDTVVLWTGAPRSGPPQEMQVTLSLLTAPRISRGKDSNPDEPWAWQSREFLRKMLIAKAVSYRIDFTHPTSGRKYGFLRLKNGTLVNVAVAEAGWAKVQPVKGGKGPRGREHEEMLDASEKAQEKGLGIFNQNAKERRESVRDVIERFDSRKLYEEIGNKTVKGVVEGVLDGSTLRVLFVPSFYSVVIRLAGAQAPIWTRERNPDPEAARDEPYVRVPQPFALQAKYLTEYCLLGRDVTVSLHGVNKDDTFFGNVLFGSKNVVDELLKSGLAKVSWNAHADDQERFAAAEKQAQSKSLGIWKNGQRAKKPSAGEFSGYVRDVRSGSRLTVEDDTGVEHDVFFSSVISPKLNARDPSQDEPLAFEAKEFLRKKVIGKRVRCCFDYQKTGSNKNDDDRELAPRRFYSVYLGNKHLPIALVEQGLGSVITHRREENRSRDYGQLLEVEANAKKHKLGIHKPNPHVHSVVDQSRLKASQAKQYMKFLQKPTTLSAVVEFVINPVRWKLYVVSLNAYISFTVAAIRSPWWNPTKGTNDEYGEDSLRFARNMFHQRKVEIEVQGSDKGGNFIGNAFFRKKNVAVTLLQEGWASLSEQADRHPLFEEYKQAQHLAQQARRGIWQKYSEKGKLTEEEKRREEEESAQQEQTWTQVLLTEIVDGNWFYCQRVDENEKRMLDNIMEQMQKTNEEYTRPPGANKWKAGDLAAAQYSEDGMYYRVKVLGEEGKGMWKVHYIDFGNAEILPFTELRLLDPSLSKLPPQAKRCHLSFLKVPTLFDDFGPEAAQQLKELTWGKVLMASIDWRDRETGALYVTLGDPETKVNINKMMVRGGLATVKKRSGKQFEKPIQQLLAEQEVARKARSFLWQYGDIPEDSDSE